MGGCTFCETSFQRAESCVLVRWRRSHVGAIGMRSPAVIRIRDKAGSSAVRQWSLSDARLLPRQGGPPPGMSRST